MLTAQETYDEILEICAESPGLKNPVYRSACVYHIDVARENEATNCIIGRFFVRHNVDVKYWPTKAVSFNGESFIPSEYHHLIPLLSEIQMIADRRISWGEVATWVKAAPKVAELIAEIDGK